MTLHGSLQKRHQCHRLNDLSGPTLSEPYYHLIARRDDIPSDDLDYRAFGRSEHPSISEYILAFSVFQDLGRVRLHVIDARQSNFWASLSLRDALYRYKAA